MFVALFSGGLDSILSVKILQEQGVDVRALSFTTPFFGDDRIREVAEANGIDIEFIDITDDYLEMLEKPKYGYGKNANPCIDCKILMIRKASRYGNYVVTGEVLGQRPMSQLKDRLNTIEKETAMGGKILRPLSAKLLEPTEPEVKGYVDREKLYGIQGRSRKEQIELMEKFGVRDYVKSAGCLLTDENYAKKLFDILDKDYDKDDINLLNLGRHFRKGDTKIIVGRNKEENEKLLDNKGDYKVLKSDGPVTLFKGEDIRTAASLTNFYRNSKVYHGDQLIDTYDMTQEEVDSLRLY